MSEQERQQFGVESGEVLIFAQFQHFVTSSHNLCVAEAGDIVICIDIEEVLPQYKHNKCHLLHPAHGVLTIEFQYQLHKTAWSGAFVGK